MAFSHRWKMRDAFRMRASLKRRIRRIMRIIRSKDGSSAPSLEKMPSTTSRSKGRIDSRSRKNHELRPAAGAAARHIYYACCERSAAHLCVAHAPDVVARDLAVALDHRAALVDGLLIRQEEVDPHVGDEDAVDDPVDEEHAVHLRVGPQHAHLRRTRVAPCARHVHAAVQVVYGSIRRRGARGRGTLVCVCGRAMVLALPYAAELAPSAGPEPAQRTRAHLSGDGHEVPVPAAVWEGGEREGWRREGEREGECVAVRVADRAQLLQEVGAPGERCEREAREGRESGVREARARERHARERGHSRRTRERESAQAQERERSLSREAHKGEGSLETHERETAQGQERRVTREAGLRTHRVAHTGATRGAR
eukprot:7386657-Prymnesium_polylepis.2